MLFQMLKHGCCIVCALLNLALVTQPQQDEIQLKLGNNDTDHRRIRFHGAFSLGRLVFFDFFFFLLQTGCSFGALPSHIMYRRNCTF